MKLEKIQQIVAEIYEAYKDDAEVIKKMGHYLEHHLPILMNSHQNRLVRKQQLEKESAKFIATFLEDQEHQYLYISSSNIFVQYDGRHYTVINENNIIHNILSKISSNGRLCSWKYKIKSLLMKKIKEQKMITSTPELHTIQFVISRMCPVLIRNRTETEYLLTVIGDSILRKETHLNHFVPAYSKEYLTTLQERCYHYFQNAGRIDTTFKYKYHEHDYRYSRIINFNRCIGVRDYWDSLLKRYTLDIYAVATHYSRRYSTADEYIINHGPDIGAREQILYLKDRDEGVIIKDFLASHTSTALKSECIAWRDMYFLWKTYLAESNLPLLVFIKNLRLHLAHQFSYDTVSDVYYGLKSDKLLAVERVKLFWSAAIRIDTEEELEPSELYTIYRAWEMYKYHDTNGLDENGLLSIIRYFHRIDLDDRGCLQGIASSEWDKRGELRNALKNLRARYMAEARMEGISLHKLYRDYLEMVDSPERIISKGYFDRHLPSLVEPGDLDQRKLQPVSWLRLAPAPAPAPSTSSPASLSTPSPPCASTGSATTSPS